MAWASEHFVMGASRLALALRVSPVLIGAVVIGFGTSAPEMVTSVLAVAAGSRDIALGNVIGSNAANVTLVLGIATLIRPATVASATLRREAPMSTLSVGLLTILLLAGVSRPEGIACLLALVVFMVLIVRGSRDGGEPIAHEVEELLGEGSPPVYRTSAEALRTGLGLAGTLGGAQLLVWGAVRIAEGIGVSQGFVGFTLVAVGTSLPELVTAIQAARKGETDLVVGNVLGSNVFNSLAVAGTVAVVSPGPLVDRGLAGPGVFMMAAVCAIAYLFMATGGCITRREGAVLLAMWVMTTPLLVVL